MNNKCVDVLKITKTIILIENELSRQLLPFDRMLYLEALIKEVFMKYSATKDLDLYKTAQCINKLLIKSRLPISIKEMQLTSQKFRECRKSLEKYNRIKNSNCLAITSSTVKRSFNKKNESSLRPLLKPMFNVLEIYKQSMLLLDHLSDKSLRCGDCILKHTLFIEALAEEAIGLDNKGKYFDKLLKLTKLIKRIRIAYINKGRNSYFMITILVKELLKESKMLIDSLNKKDYIYIIS